MDYEMNPPDVWGGLKQSEYLKVSDSTNNQI